MDIGCVVPCSSAVIVHSLVYAVIYVQAQEGGWGIQAEHPFNVIVNAQFQVHEVLHLGFPGSVQLFEILEGARVPGLQAYLLSGFRVNAVIERYFQDLGRVQVACQQICFLAEGAHLYAAGAAALAGVFKAFALTDELLHIGVRIEY